MTRGALSILTSGVLALAGCDGSGPVGTKVASTGSMLNAGTSVAVEKLMTSDRELFKAMPDTVPALPGNAASPEKLALGKILFFDPRIAASHAISCSSCHNIDRGGTDTEPTSIGHHWQRGGRNAPIVLNAVYNTAQFWGGRRIGVG